MKKIIKNLLIISLSIFCFAAIAEEPKNEKPSPVGVWLVADKEAKVELYMNGDVLEGKIVWLAEPNEKDGTAKIDIKNPDKSLVTRPIMNMVFLNGFKKDKRSDKWIDGTIYDAKSGKTYSAWLKLKDDNNMQLRGYVGISLLGRTEEWTRSQL